MSMTGVPSNASSPRTFKTPSFTSSRSTMQSETGFGRSGDRIANTPFSADVPGGLPGAQSGPPGRTSRGPRDASSPPSARDHGNIVHLSRYQIGYQIAAPVVGHRPFLCRGSERNLSGESQWVGKSCVKRDWGEGVFTINEVICGHPVLFRCVRLNRMAGIWFFSTVEP
jgi:hypothetical protein